MAYIVWLLIGFVVAAITGAVWRRSPLRPTTNSAMLASVFGALIGGVIGDGLPHSLAGSITLTGILGAVFGALLFCWAVRDRASDTES